MNKTRLYKNNVYLLNEASDTFRNIYIYMYIYRFSDRKIYIHIQVTVATHMVDTAIRCQDG